MLKESTNLKLGGMILIMMGMLLYACAPEVSARPLYAQPCTPPTLEDNIYRQTPPPILGSYYSTAFTNIDFSNPADVQRYETVQYEAFKLLVTLTERWSDSIDIHLGTKQVRITITYISPDLVQTIILNHYLLRKTNGFLNGGFDTEILSKMDSIASRNEHIFLITLTASQFEQDSHINPVFIRLPLHALVMTNSANVQVIRQHDDHNLEERIDLTNSPTYGYISFPLAVTRKVNEIDICEFLLDKTTNTHLTLSIPYIEINGTQHTTRAWMFEYAPLLKIASNSYSSDNSLQVERDPRYFLPNKEPPVWMTSENAKYWENLARFIWYETTLDP